MRKLKTSYKLYDKVYDDLLGKLRLWTESLVAEFELAQNARIVDLQDVVEIGNAITQVREIVKRHTDDDLLEQEDNDIFRGGMTYTEYRDEIEKQM